MMGVTRNMMKNIRETGHPDGKRGGRAGPKNRTADGLSKQNVIPSAEKRTERRAAAKAVDQPVKLPK